MVNFINKILTTFVLLTLISFAINGQTNVSGNISSNATWTLANSPYVVLDTVVVLLGDTLTIEPGVVVKFADNARLELRNACLIAEGTLTDSILFTSNSLTPDSGSWSDIYLNGSVATLLANFSYCNINYSTNGINSDVDNYDSTIFIKNSTFYRNITALNGGYFSVAVDSCNFLENTNGLNNFGGPISYCNFSHNQFGLVDCDVIATNCLIHSNQIGFKDCMYLNVKNCIVDSNLTGINTLWFPIIDSCLIRKNQIGIFEGSSYSVGASITNSSIDSNSLAGLYFTINSNNSITNCEIKGNVIGIIEEGGGSFGNNFTRNSIENNIIGVELGDTLSNFYCNKICNNSSYDLKYTGIYNATFSNNYWCTSDSITTQAVIFDGHDSAGLGFVNFMPLDTVQCYLCAYISISITSVTEPSCSTCTDGAITVDPTNGTPPYFYLWNTSPVQTTQTATGLPNGGPYIVWVTDSAGCLDYAFFYLQWNLGVNEITGNLSFSIFPNPASDYLAVVLPANNTKTEIKIFNLLGQLEYLSISTGQVKNIDISNLTSGIYIIQLETDNKIGRRKFIKE